MRAMILAAGRGERMRPLTDTSPKPLLEIAGKSLIEYHIDAFVKAGIFELVINHAWLGEQIEERLGDGARYGAHIQYSRESQALETAGGIINALHLLGDEPFIVINGDVFTDYDFSVLKQSAETLASQALTSQRAASQNLAHLVLVNNPEHHPTGDFYCHDGIVSDPQSFHRAPASGRRWMEKAVEQSAYTFSGIACYSPEFFSGRETGKQALAPMLRAAMKKQQISGEVYPGNWWDIGTPERLRELDMIYRSA